MRQSFDHFSDAPMETANIAEGRTHLACVLRSKLAGSAYYESRETRSAPGFVTRFESVESGDIWISAWTPVSVGQDRIHSLESRNTVCKKNAIQPRNMMTSGDCG
jgi:hypothetical protein